MDFYQKTLFDKGIYEINLMPQRSYFDVHNSIQLLNAGWHGIYAEEFTPELLQWLDGKNAISELDSVEVGLAPEL